MPAMTAALWVASGGAGAPSPGGRTVIGAAGGSGGRWM